MYSAYQKTLLVTENAPVCISRDANFKTFPEEAPCTPLQEGVFLSRAVSPHCNKALATLIAPP